MKNLLSFILPIIFVCVYSLQSVNAQGVVTLKVIGIQGFPDLPADTAFEGQLYALDVIVVNGTNTAVNSTIEVQLKVDSIETTLVSDPQPALLPGDTLILSLTGYTFDQSLYQAGSNIVVVWPRVIGPPSFPVDTFYTNVFFVPLNSLGDGSPDINLLNTSVYPVPSSDFLNFAGTSNVQFEYVRIFSMSGTLIKMESMPADQRIYIGFLPPGHYLAEVGLKGKRIRSVFIRQ